MNRVENKRQHDTYIPFVSPDLTHVSVAARIGPVWPRISPPVANLRAKRDNRNIRTVKRREKETRKLKITERVPAAPQPHQEGTNDASSPAAMSPVKPTPR